MALENRKGNLYFYEKRREGDRVVSEYVGSGIVADLAHKRAEIERAKLAAERERFNRMKMSIAEIDQSLDQFSGLVDTLMAAELVSKGYHRHKRQWRRRR